MPDAGKSYSSRPAPDFDDRQIRLLGSTFPLQFDHCQNIGGAVPAAQRGQRFRVERFGA